MHFIERCLVHVVSFFCCVTLNKCGPMISLDSVEKIVNEIDLNELQRLNAAVLLGFSLVTGE